MSLAFAKFTVLATVIAGASWYTTDNLFADARSATSKLTSVYPDAKNLAREGNIEGAMAQARVLMSRLQENNWNWEAIDWNLLRLPEQIYHEQESLRGTWQFSFYRRTESYDSELAFTCSLYARKNLRIIPGIEGKNFPEGVFIVGWKNGQVTQVPVSQVRMYEHAPRTWVPVFPGMAVYNENQHLWGKAPS